MAQILESEKLFAAFDYMRDNYEDFSKEERLFARDLSDEIEQSETWEEFESGISGYKQLYRKEGLKTEFSHFLDKLHAEVPEFDNEVVQTIRGLQSWSWTEINDSLQNHEALSEDEIPYWDIINQIEQKEYADRLMVHYAKEKRTGNPEVFESAVTKIFSGFDRYDEALDAVENIPDEDQDIYMEELKRIVDEARLDHEIKSELESIVSDASSPLQLAAFTDERLDIIRDSRPGLAARMEAEIKELYISALPTERI